MPVTEHQAGASFAAFAAKDSSDASWISFARSDRRGIMVASFPAR